MRSVSLLLSILFVVNGEKTLFMEDCPYLVDEDHVSTGSGNSFNVDFTQSGRSGNRFMMLSNFLSMGYCCRSSRVSFPSNDLHLPSRNGYFVTDKYVFDFTDANVPEKFRYLGDDQDICVENYRSLFRMDNVNDELLSCMEGVYLRGCEKLYMGEISETDDCPVSQGNGNLVIHIRSGDIFEDNFKNKNFGQPPLQFYILAIMKKKWDSVTILTIGSSNPVYLALESIGKTGVLGRNIRFLNNRSLYEDVKDMICADGLVLARSSLGILTSSLTKARSFFIPFECGPGTFRRACGSSCGSKKHHGISFPTPDNTTALIEEYPTADVYGINWGESYDIYTTFTHSCDQNMKMLVYDGINSLDKCVK